MRSEEPTHEPSLVRPYTLTGGRTDSGVHLPVEATVERLESARPPRWQGHDVRARIMALCADAPSIAEISAHLSLPLGVTRVLVGDLVTQGHLRVRGTLGDAASNDERRELIGRTLRGLRAL